MSRQPAEHLAWIKRVNPLWSIRHVSEGYGWTAHRTGFERIWAGTLASLERQLSEARPLNGRS